MFGIYRLRHYVVPAIISAVILCGCTSTQPHSTPPDSTPPATTAARHETSSTPTDTTAATVPESVPSTEPAVSTEATAPVDTPVTTTPPIPTDTPETTAPTEIPETTAPVEVPEATAPAEIPETTAPAETPETTAPTISTEPAPSEPEDPTFTVTFRDHDGQVLAVRQVASGQDAPLPPNPSRSGYVFAGWEGNYQSITAHTTITAAYVSADSSNLFTLESTVSADRVYVTVRLQGHILACGIECHLAYDSAVLQYVGMTKHNNVEANHITLNSRPQVILVWAGSRNMTADTIRDGGTLLELEFRVTDPTATDTVLSFIGDSMYVDVVDENGTYSSGQFTLTKGVVHLK